MNAWRKTPRAPPAPPATRAAATTERRRAEQLLELLDRAARDDADPVDEVPFALFVTGDTVGVLVRSGAFLLDRSTGSTIDRIASPKWRFSWGPGLADGRLVFGHRNEVISYVSAAA